MTQDQWIIVLLKVVLIADVVAVLAFAGDYTRLAKWWTNPVGRTIVIKDLLLVLAFIPSIMSLFFKFSRLTSLAAAWFDIALFIGIAAVMVWRIIVFERIHRRGPPGSSNQIPRDSDDERRGKP